MRRSWGGVVVVAIVILVLWVAGWGGGLPFQPAALYSDAVISHYGAAVFLQSSIQQGQFPLWQDVILGGGPFAANPLNKTAYPFQWLLVALTPLAHLNLLIISHMALAGVGMWRWAQSLKMRPASALLAGLAYGLSPRLWGHLGAGHLDIVYAMAWLPWLLMLVWHGRGELSRRRYVSGLALVGALLVLADLRVSLFAGLLALVLLLWRTTQARQPERLALAAGAFGLALPLLAALLVPLAIWSPYLSRNTITASGASVFAVEWLGFSGLLLPPHVGGTETLVYVGLPVLVLAGIGLWSRPLSERLLWGGVLLVAALWALGPNAPLWLLLSQVEVLQWFRVPGRAWIVVAVVVPLLAGYGLQALLNTTERWQTEEPPPVVFWWRLGAAGFAGMLAICGGALLYARLAEIPASAGVILLINSMGIGGVLLAVLLRRSKTRWVAVALVSLTVVDLSVTAINRAEWRPKSSDIVGKAWSGRLDPISVLLDDQPDRIYSPNYALPQYLAYDHGLSLFYGVDPFQLQAAVAAIEGASNIPADTYSVILPPLQLDESEVDFTNANREYLPNLDELARWRVSHLVATYPYDLDDLTVVAVTDDLYIYRNERYDPAGGASPALLPSEVIARLHGWTLAAYWMTAVSFGAVFVSWLVLLIRGVTRHET